ncbi:MAG: manganese efflux pump [Clostridia bacterium]|nr:MAG: manganese efflux pump [Clostridia bacterium]
MQLLEVIGVAVALGTDAFSLAVGLGLGGVRRLRALRFSFTVCLFHVFMPLVGLMLGSYVSRRVGAWAGVAGGLVLVGIGLGMLVEGLRSQGQGGRGRPVTGNGSDLPVQAGGMLDKFWGNMSMAGSVSLDALSVGFGLGTVEVNLGLTVLIMGVVAGTMTAAGFLFGRQAGRLAGRRAQMLGGLVLLAVGTKFLLQ